MRTHQVFFCKRVIHQILIKSGAGLVILALIVLFSSADKVVDNDSGVKNPNVLFIAVDDLNDWIGFLDNRSGIKTPNLDSLCQEGLLFTNAHCSQAVCAASRNSLLSGLHPSSTGWYGSIRAMQNTYGEVMKDNKMMPQYFKDNGYRTLAAGKIFHNGVSDYPEMTDLFWDDYAPHWWDSIPPDIKRNGFGYGGRMFYPFPEGGGQLIRYYGPSYNKGHSLCGGPVKRNDMPGGKMYDERIAEWGIEQLRRDHDKPFFLALGFIRPHVPYTAPEKYFEMYDPDSSVLPEVPLNEMEDIPVIGKAIAYGMTENGDHYDVVKIPGMWSELVRSYQACISFTDEQIGRVLDELRKSKYADNTIIVLWSDNGQHLGEKSHWRKQSLWQESTHVPLIISVPGMGNGGQKCSRTVTLLDLYPTLIDLCGLTENPHLQGNSIVPLIKNPQSQWPYYALSVWEYKNYAVTGERWRYISYRDGTEELYDHIIDPGEHTNLSGYPEYEKIIRQLKKQLPSSDALPAGMQVWKGDNISNRIKQWEAEGIPQWLE
jgi:arylsulfatase A-like enzyme